MEQDKKIADYQNRIAWALESSHFKTKKQLADALDMRPNTITDAFKRPPTRETLERIAKELKVDRFWLETGKSHDKTLLELYHFRSFIQKFNNKLGVVPLKSQLDKIFDAKDKKEKDAALEGLVFTIFSVSDTPKDTKKEGALLADCIHEMISCFIGPKRTTPNNNNCANSPKAQHLSIPLIGSAAADNAAASRAELEAEAPGEEVQVIKEHYRLVKIVGNSMEPVLLDGQYAMIGSEIRSGEEIKAKGWIGIIQLDCSGLEDGICSGIATFCKRVYPVGKNDLLLTSINSSECAPFTVARERVLHLWPVHGVFFMGHGMTPSDNSVSEN